MHPRNPYNVQVNFDALSDAYPPLRKHLSGSKRIIDFKNDASLRCLTQALLHRDFKLSLELPDDRLCPPVPNRLNYVLWIEDIIATQPSRDVKGVDIGTGASAIYPLLACSRNPSWAFVATELDDFSLKYAKENVTLNTLDGRIHTLKATTSGHILPMDALSNEPIDFTMCNPPFYASLEEVKRSAEGKALEPNAACTGAPVEMITAGGEAEFVGRMVKESVQHGTRCRWYTSMLGMLSSVTHVVGVIKEHNITNYAITEFIQGQTRRWAVGWSFTNERLPDSISRISNPGLRPLMPPHNTIRQQVSSTDCVQGVFDSMSGIHITKEGERSVVVTAQANTWTRSARRKRKNVDTQMKVDTDGQRDSEGELRAEPALVCAVELVTTGNLSEVVFHWRKGAERNLFESFCSHISRKLVSRE
ncbi:hypothetical protein CYLTODRAFT_438918 [Cylindrobasidium torrendii FP15055 ss-10]|uniref:S-adenosyl-L-methionine dependent methyltransferase n=1 Tax=Cylindrobasidium torrendii FP15055 ss-10 TaxID=1314674 RepID=A0A0D7AYN5_9AGAR|nr:hypothetical protein CYLTODRAFT_438918 [Cylindrobasidium torrendii FP15055 ss-10]